MEIFIFIIVSFFNKKYNESNVEGRKATQTKVI